MKKLKSLFLILLCLVLIIPAMDGNAATKKQQALKAYKKFLSTAKVNVAQRGEFFYYDAKQGKDVEYKGTKASNVKFALAYINNDSVPELILYTKVAGEDVYGVFTCKNGKIRRVVVRASIHDKIAGYYKKTGYFLQKSYSDGKVDNWKYMKMSGNSGYIVGSKGSGGSYYVINESMMSKKGFNAKIKKLTKGRSLTKLKFYKNTKANRTKRLK